MSSRPADPALVTWSPECRRAYTRWFGRGCVLLAWAVLALAVVHPPHGLGVRVCLFEAATGVPCPGCGLSRSLSCTLHGDLLAAWHYHAFGPVFAIVFAVIAVVGVLPRRAHGRIAAAIGRHPGRANGVYAVLVGAFLTYGVARALLHVCSVGIAPGS